MPVWHVSISVWPRDGQTRRNEPRIAEREAVTDLHGVGGPSEWWIWSPARVGHLRVPVTDDENELITPRPVVADAGPAGPERRRSR